MQVCTITVPFIAAWELQKLKKQNFQHYQML